MNGAQRPAATQPTGLTRAAGVVLLAAAGLVHAAGPGEKMYLEFLEQEHIYPDEALATYVQKVGDRLAKQSPDSDREFHFYVVDEPSVNAFALPDGYIFVHRGLIGYLESEDQLAAVIGHEIAHVTKRHNRRLTTRDVAGKAAGFIGALMTGRGELMDVANTVNSPLVMGYKRNLELEADEYGSVYLAKAGYNPYAMIEVIQVLKDQETFAKQVSGQTQGYHGLFSTHPKNDKRLHDAVQRSAFAIPDQLPDYEGDFWERVNGLVYGNEAAAGIVKDHAYYHGNLRFVVEFPEGWDVGATSTRITGRNPAGASAGMITLERQNAPKEKQTPEQYVTETLKRTDVSAGESFETNGFDAYLARLDAEAGKSVAISMIGIVFKDSGVYMFKGEAKDGADVEQFATDFKATVESFRGMTPADLRTANDQRIRVITAEPGDTYASLAKKSSIRRYPEETLRLLNGDHPVGEPRAGDFVKIVQ